MRTAFWQPFGSVVNQLQNFNGDVNRLMDYWLGEATSGRGGFPPVNVWEEGDHICIEAELPGVDPASLDLSVAGGNEFTLKGERTKPAGDTGVWHRQERVAGAFTRSFTLPFAVDADKVEAKLEHGVLHVRLAKHESARPRKISVKAV